MAYSILKIYVDIEAKLFVDNEFIADLLKNSYYRLELRKGVYDLLIISTKEDTIKYSCTYTMADNDMEDILRIKLNDSLEKLLDRKYRVKDSYIRTPNEGYSVIRYRNNEEKNLPYRITWDEGFNIQGYLIFMIGGRIKEGLLIPGFVSESDYPTDGKWGVLDIDGNICIEPTYSKISQFSYDVFLVENDGYWGVLDAEDTKLVDFKYLDLFKRENKIICVKDKFNKWGCISKTGDIVLDFIYDHVLDLGYAFALNIDGKLSYSADVGYINGGDIFLLYDNGEIIKTDYLAISDDGYVKDSYHEGRYKISPDTREYIVEYFEEGWKYITIPHEYIAAYEVSEGLVKVKNEHGLYGFLNTEGVEVIPCMYADATNFCHGLSFVRSIMFDRYLINKSGERALRDIGNISEYVGGVIIARIFDTEDLYSFDGCKLTKLTDGEYSLIHRETFDIFDTFHVRSKSSNCNGLIDREGNILVEPQYDKLYIYDSWHQIYMCEKGLLKGLYDRKKNTMVLLCEYDSIGFNSNAKVSHNFSRFPTSDTLLELVKGGKYGFADIYGYEVDTICIYDSYEFMGDNFVKVKINEEYGIIEFVPEIKDNKVIFKTKRVAFNNLLPENIIDIQYKGDRVMDIYYSSSNLHEEFWIDKDLNMVRVKDGLL